MDKCSIKNLISKDSAMTEEEQLEALSNMKDSTLDFIKKQTSKNRARIAKERQFYILNDKPITILIEE